MPQYVPMSVAFAPATLSVDRCVLTAEAGALLCAEGVSERWAIASFALLGAALLSDLTLDSALGLRTRQVLAGEDSSAKVGRPVDQAAW